MEYARISCLDKPLSRLIYGSPDIVMNGSPEEAADCLERAYQYGFRVFDTANAYARSEENIGYWLSSTGHREDIVLCDKGFNPGMVGSEDVYSADTLRSQIELSLKRLQTDSLDLYVLHRDDPTRPVREVIDLLNDYKRQGILRAFGASNWTLERIREEQAYAGEKGQQTFSVVSPCYSLAEFTRDPWGGSVTLSGNKNKPYRDYLARRGLPVFTYSSLARGYLSGKYRTDMDKPIEDVLWWAPIREYHTEKNLKRLKKAEDLARKKGVGVSTIALAWLLHEPMNLFPIISPTGAEHIEEALQVFELSLTEEELSSLTKEE